MKEDSNINHTLTQNSSHATKVQFSSCQLFSTAVCFEVKILSYLYHFSCQQKHSLHHFFSRVCSTSRYLTTSNTINYYFCLNILFSWTLPYCYYHYTLIVHQLVQSIWSVWSDAKIGFSRWNYTMNQTQTSKTEPNHTKILGPGSVWFIQNRNY